MGGTLFLRRTDRCIPRAGRVGGTAIGAGNRGGGCPREIVSCRPRGRIRVGVRVCVRWLVVRRCAVASDGIVRKCRFFVFLGDAPGAIASGVENVSHDGRGGCVANIWICCIALLGNGNDDMAAGGSLDDTAAAVHDPAGHQQRTLPPHGSSGARIRARTRPRRAVAVRSAEAEERRASRTGGTSRTGRAIGQCRGEGCGRRVRG
mmetsp:Transcript_35566/g.65824  ORF Transcript_35566/g.65824 Transcript_35566/m.65824 type:complete len:205 (+) Transcript_35566:348-962(+)